MDGPIYSRDQSSNVPSEVKNIERDLEEFKSTQILGNDNLIVHYYEKQMVGEVVGSGSNARFKSTFVFDEPPVESLVTLTFVWGNSVPLSFSYTEQYYDDPNTIEDDTQQAAYIEFSPDTNLSSVFVYAYAKSTSPGTLTLTRVA